MPYPANGYLGLNSISSEFGSQVKYNKGGTNPQGQVIVYIRSCNNRDGSVDPLCDLSKPATWHVYFIKSNSISGLSLRNGSASFGSKTNVYEQLPDGSKLAWTVAARCRSCLLRMVRQFPVACTLVPTLPAPIKWVARPSRHTSPPEESGTRALGDKLQVLQNPAEGRTFGATVGHAGGWPT